MKKSIPALNVGGDYYDFIHLDDSRLVISLGDVSGNGLAASLVMANLQATIRGLALFDADPEKCLEKANKLIFQSTDSRTFVTLFYGILDTRKHTLEYANSGQDLPLLFSASNNPVQLDARGMALGIIADATYDSNKISINPGDHLAIYSDGILEAMNAQKEEFGNEKFQDMVHRSRDVSARTLIEKIIDAVNDHLAEVPHHDDMTMVLLHRKDA